MPQLQMHCTPSHVCRHAFLETDLLHILCRTVHSRMTSLGHRRRKCSWRWCGRGFCVSQCTARRHRSCVMLVMHMQCFPTSPSMRHSSPSFSPPSSPSSSPTLPSAQQAPLIPYIFSVYGRNDSLLNCSCLTCSGGVFGTMHGNTCQRLCYPLPLLCVLCLRVFPRWLLVSVRTYATSTDARCYVYHRHIMSIYVPPSRVRFGLRVCSCLCGGAIGGASAAAAGAAEVSQEASSGPGDGAPCFFHHSMMCRALLPLRTACNQCSNLS